MSTGSRSVQEGLIPEIWLIVMNTKILVVLTLALIVAVVTALRRVAFIFLQVTGHPFSVFFLEQWTSVQLSQPKRSSTKTNCDLHA